MILKELLFLIIYIFHILIWTFLLFGGFYSKFYAYIIIYYLIPFIYLSHILPFHPLELAKNRTLSSVESPKRQEFYKPILILPYITDRLHDLFEKSTFNPLSPQGMLILGMIINTRIIKCKP